MSGRDPVAGSSSNAHKLGAGSRGVLTDVLLLVTPARLDGVEVVGVRGQVQESNAEVLAPELDPRALVRDQVVHHKDVAAT